MKLSREADPVGALLRAAVDIADGCSDLGDRRLATIQCLARLTDSDSGYWGWCRGRLESEKIMLVSFIHFGFDEAQLAAFQQFALDARLQEWSNRRLQEHVARNARPDGVWCVLSRDNVPEMAADPSFWVTQAMNRIGMGHALQAGRYVLGDAFSSLTLGRRPGKPDYGDADRDLIDLAYTSIPWLWANPDETVPQQDVEALSPRQRAVTYLLLEGLGRKKIAARLGIGEETVNHHIKVVFRHFGVRSATELAALFLRRQ